MKVVHLLVGLGLSFSLAACGGGDEDPMTPPGGEPPPGGEGSEPPPGGEGSEPPPEPAVCGEEPGTVYAVTLPWQAEFIAGEEPGTNEVSLLVPVDESADNVLLSVDLYESVVGDVEGALAGAIAPGTYPIEGVDLDQFECSICVYADGDNSSWSAAGGTLTIEAIDPAAAGAFRMSLTGVTLGGVDLEGEFLPDCTVSLADTTIEGVFAE